MTLDPHTTATYLTRIGAKPPHHPDATELQTLQEQHVLSVPFENLDCFRREPLELGAGAVHKIAHHGRGGGCYELNSALGLLLESVGYPVTVLGARVYHGDTPVEPLRHLVLLVETPEPWLVDAGFGFGANRNSRFPLRFDTRAIQHDPHGQYQLFDAPHGDVDVVCNDVPLYRLERHPRAVDDFELSLWWFHTAPSSPMVQALFCLLPTEAGRVSLKNRTLVTIEDGNTDKSDLAGPEEIRTVLQSRFGMHVADIPDLGRSPAELASLMAAEIVSRSR